MESRAEPIIIKTNLNSEKSKVWNAITEVEHMRGWFFPNIPDFEPRVGFETEFNVKEGERNFLHQWKIIEVIPETKIVYDWSYAKYKGQGFVTFDLVDNESKCQLILSYNGLDTFPNDIPEFTRKSCKDGWKYFINQLREYLWEV